MVEQDFLICKAVAAIFEDKYLAGQVTMRGGFLGPRSLELFED
jgi:hypothetical protein